MQDNNLQNDCSQQSIEVYAFPASYAQQQLWFLHEMDPNSAAYNIPFAFRLRGNLNIPVLERSINEIIRRHETFRTTFALDNGSLTQFISSRLFLPLTLIDISSHPEKEKEASRLIYKHTISSYDLFKGPLLKTSLVVISENESILLLNFHHIILDHTSVLAFTNELTAIYNSLLENKNHSLPQPSIQFADWVVWQNEEKQLEAVNSKLNYWTENLEGQLPFLDLPTDKQRPSRQTYSGAERKVNLSKELSDKIREFSRKEKKSLFVLLLAAYKILFYRYTNKTDITVGCPFANRNQPGLEEVMGCCMNTLPLRTTFSPEDSFLDVLNKVRDVTLGAQANQEVSFEQIVEQVHPLRDGSFNPLFQVSFMFQDPPMKLYLKGIECESLEVHSQTSKFDCTLWMWDDPEGIKGLFEFSTDLFEDGTIDRMFINFSALLEDIVKSPEKKVSDFDILSKNEKNTLVNLWNNTRVDYPKDKCIHQLFETAAENYPRNTAVEFEDKKISYKELDKKANQLARYLISIGVGKESFVGIFLERSIDVVVALLGTLKSGGTYIPLDPAFPRDRLSYMLEDAGIQTLVTQQKYSGWFNGFTGNEVLLDTNYKIIDKQKKSNLNETISSDSLAYVIYTSGSTGRPKGVQIQHRSLVNFLISMQREPGLNESDSLLSVTTLSFDIAGLEIFLPLITGAKLVLVSKETTLDGKALLSEIESGNITIMQATPTTFRLMLAAGWNKKLPLKILCGGEPLPADLAKELLNYGSELWNMYGPTETTVWSTIKKISSANSITIGKPIANTSIYILDSKNKLVPIGVTGELCIGGDGLARGYHNRTDLTDKAFIPHPFENSDEAKIYKTGDLARYKLDGEIECLGRVDHQVKVRGFRIELGEIETVLTEHELVKQVLVVAQTDQADNSRLVAYLTVDHSRLPDLENFTKEYLEEWQLIWNDAYKKPKKVTDPTFDISGWKSSYNGQPIPDDQMREWVDHTVKSILSFKPDNILEIGCGTGLLLFRLAPACNHFTGIDFSEIVLNATKNVVEDKKISNVELYCRKADDLDDLKSEFYDIIIINSVIQYFPGAEYFLMVIKKASKLLKPGGKIFIGDVRNRNLLDVFAYTVEIARANETIKISELLQSVNNRILEEEELVFDPQFFHLLKNTVPGLTNVEVHLKRGKFLNELTKYRYDVVLHFGNDNLINIQDWVDAHEKNLSLEEIRSLLENFDQPVIAVKNIPNSRIYNEIKLFNSLNEVKGDILLSEFLSKSDINNNHGIDPGLLYELCEKYDRKLLVTWSSDELKGCFDAIFYKGNLSPAFNPVNASLPDKDLKNYINNPLISQFKRVLIPALKESLSKKLPDYMIPSVFMIIDEFPLTPNGKIDRKSLPQPGITRISSNEKYTPPDNEIEKQLTEIWQKVLRVKKISVHDNFFDLGGHSLLVVQLFKQIEEQIKVELSIALIFECPTINQLAKKIMEELEITN